MPQDGMRPDLVRMRSTASHSDSDQGPCGNGPYRGTMTCGPWACDANEVVVFSRDGQFPSDHHPIPARLRLRQGTAVSTKPSAVFRRRACRT